ncbi:MAG: carboxymuconolactone decarboxylase family protein [Deltaproteobacteria bacterium]|nr:MAG: carboxymuconolactone decarboxylase family protein [Deltaproteobacteria bacterium]
MNKQFTRRLYRSFGEFWTDLKFLSSNVKKLNSLRLISPAFRERLMLAVVSVYGCRYCSYIHTREALRIGINKEEITGILSGSTENFPEEEAIALIYAQHWADSNADPEPESIQRLVETYGSEKAGAISFALRIYRVSNLFGNSLDYLLDKVSLGKLGKMR